MNLNSKMHFLLVILLFNRLFLTFYYFLFYRPIILGNSVYPIRRFNSSVCPLRAFSNTPDRYIIVKQFHHIIFRILLSSCLLLPKFNILNSE